MPRTIHSLAGAILAALSSTPALAATAHLPAQSEQKPFATTTTATNANAVYSIELKLDSALHQGLVDKAQHQAIKKQQAQFISSLKSQFGQIKVLGQSVLFGNQVSVELSEQQAAQLVDFADVKKVSKLDPVLNAQLLSQLPVPQQQSNSFAAAVLPEALAGAEGGQGVTIAVLSTGVDYTHKLLGGAGTADAYQQAIKNAGAPYKGFPTAVVTSGRDFISDHPDFSFGYDDNPIESDLVYEIPGQGRYPTGRGTLLASYIHQLAPAAKIRAGKMYNIMAENGEIAYLAGPNHAILTRALEWALDPNGDGDLSDKADVILLDFQFYGHGVYSQKDNSGDQLSLYPAAIQRAASTGSLVVVAQGEFESSNRFATPYQATAPAALAVGSAYNDGDIIKIDMNSPHGPVRGELELLKPDVIAPAKDITGAAVGAGEATATDQGSIYAAAHAAATAAILKGKHPKLSSVELKSLISTTANSTVVTPDGATQAEVSWIGHGVVDATSAQKSPLLAWDADTNQTGINFGLQEVPAHQSTTLTRHIYLRNLTDKALTYKIAIHANQPERHKALSWQHATSVTIDAGRSTLVPVSLTIDSALLANWPMLTGDDYSAEKWRETELDGYIQLRSEGQPTSQLAWQVRARTKADIQKNYSSFEEYLSLDGYRSTIGAKYFDVYKVLAQDFKNTSDKTVEYAVYPTLRQRTAVPVHQEESEGTVLKAVGNGVFPEASCSSGQKFSVATSFFLPKELATANYIERGDALVAWEIFKHDFTANNATLPANQALTNSTEADVLLRGYVSIDFVTGKPVGYYTDLSMEYDINNPTARFKPTKLPVRFTSDSSNLLVEYCLEELEPWGIVPEDLNHNLGYIVSTDRDAMPEAYEPIMQFNPVNMGAIHITYEYDWFGNLIEKTDNQSNRVLLSPAPAAEPDRVYSERLSLAPGESATLTGINEGMCGFGYTCGKGFMLMALDSNFNLVADIRTGDAKSTVATPRAGQQFLTTEHTATGISLGFVQLDSFGYFAEGGELESDRKHLLAIVDAIPGSPIRLTPAGELLIANADTLDFETQSELTFNVQANLGDDILSAAVPVTIKLQNINDNSPQLSSTVQTSYQLTADQELSVSLQNWFSDADNEGLTLSLSALPAGLKYNSEQQLLHGTVSQSSTITITATDGDHKTTAELKLTVPEAPAKSSGGSINFLWLVLLAMTGAVRLGQHRAA